MDHARHQLDADTSKHEDNPEVLLRKIQHTRAEIGETVNSIQDRLSPDRMKFELKNAARDRLENAKENVRMRAEQWQSRIAERIVNNPIPAAMVGVGIIWMWKQAIVSAREDHRRYQEFYSLDPCEDWPEYDPEQKSGRHLYETSRPKSALETVKTKAQVSSQQAREQISQWTSQAQDSLQEWKSRASSKTDHLRIRARERGERAKGEFQRYLQDNPLTVGAMTFAIGAAVGLSLPRTQKEDQWLGETRDKVFQQAKSTVQDIIPQAQRMTGEIKETTVDTFQEQRKGSPA